LIKIKSAYDDLPKCMSWKVLETVLSHNNKISSEIVLQPLLFVADVEMDDEELKQGVPDPPKLEELLDSQEEGAEDDKEEEVNKNLPPDEAADSDMDGSKLSDTNEKHKEEVNKNSPLDEAPDSDKEGKLVDTSEEQSTAEACGGCAI